MKNTPYPIQNPAQAIMNYPNKIIMKNSSSSRRYKKNIPSRLIAKSKAIILMIYFLEYLILILLPFRIMKNITWIKIAPSRIAALKITENMEPMIENMYFSTQFPWKAISKLVTHIRNSTILLTKMKIHSGTECKE